MKTNMERLPELHANLAKIQANLRDIEGAFHDKVNEIKTKKDPATGKSIADMIADCKKKIASLEDEINVAWQFPHQTNMDLE